MTLKLSVSGVRGIAGKSLTPELCVEMAEAFAAYTKGGRIVIGTDTRPSRSILKTAILKGLSESGCLILDAGIVPTPTVSVLVKEKKADGGIVITASHNPVEWNGLKFINNKGLFLTQAEADKLFSIWRERKFRKGPSSTPKTIEQPHGPHLSKIFGIIDTKTIGSKSFKVAIDCVNGAASKIAPKMLKDLGCKVFPIHNNIDLEFPHDPEPLPKNLKDLSKLVKKEKADIGFAVDPDADRLAIVSEKGEPIGEENTLALAVAHVLEHRAPNSENRTVATNLSTTRVIDDIAEKFGCKVIRTKIGEINVVEEMIKQDAVIGGEGNGGVIYPPVCHNRDALTGMALILEYMAKTGKSVSELVGKFPQYYMLKTKIPCASTEKAAGIIKKVKELFKNEKITTMDGIKINLSDSWIHVRASNTEPVLRIIAEAKGRAETEKLVKLIQDLLKK